MNCKLLCERGGVFYDASCICSRHNLSPGLQDAVRNAALNHCPREAFSSLGQIIDYGGIDDVILHEKLCVDSPDLLAAFHVRRLNAISVLQAAWPQQCRVDCIQAVRGADHQEVVHAFEPINDRKELSDNSVDRTTIQTSG